MTREPPQINQDPEIAVLKKEKKRKMQAGSASSCAWSSSKVAQIELKEICVKTTACHGIISKGMV